MIFLPVARVPGINGVLRAKTNSFSSSNPFEVRGLKKKKQLSTVRGCQRLEWWIANDPSPVSWDPQTGKPNAHIPCSPRLPPTLSVCLVRGEGKLSLFFFFALGGENTHTHRQNVCVVKYIRVAETCVAEVKMSFQPGCL